MHLAAPNNWILIYILNCTHGSSGKKKRKTMNSVTRKSKLFVENILEKL